MLLSLVLLAVGITLLVAGGEALVRGASALASNFGVPPVVIGLTVVAFGTSAPELAVNVQAAVDGKPGISFGNIMGSNLANIGLIVGLAALIRPLAIHSKVIRRELPMMLVATVAVVLMGFDRRLRGEAIAQFDRVDGLLLLVLFSVFLTYLFRDIRQSRSRRSDYEVPPYPPLVSILLSVLGIAGLVGGGRITVNAAHDIAVAVGASDFVIGLTVVAIGTSLPELATALVATYRKHADLAVGNVVGSNIFNLLFVLATTSVIHPVPLPRGGWIDLLAVLGLSVLLVPFSISGNYRILRWEGALLLIAYFAYMGARAAS